jgi:probable F420-dependent oxidoreductase
MFDRHRTIADMFDEDLTKARAELRAALGPFGIWLRRNVLPADAAERADTAAELDELPFGAVWIGGSPRADLSEPEALLAGSRNLVVGTSIVNIWYDPPADVAATTHRLLERFGSRFVLGVGAGHRENVEPTGQEYRRPLSAVRAFLDGLDAAAPPVPAARRAVAALGPKALALSAERSLGALPYLATPEHTRRARETLGAGPLLVAEHKVVLETDPARARERAREQLASYLRLPNYIGNLLRFGFTEDDVTGGGSDRLVDALVLWGDVETVVTRAREHLDAGADQIALQASAVGGGVPREEWRRLAEVLR